MSTTKSIKAVWALRPVGLTKKQIRCKILARLKIQKEEDRDKKSKKIKEKLFRTSVFRKTKVVMFYVSFDGEVNTQGMIREAHRLGKIVAVPVCKNGKITIRPCLFREKGKFEKGPYGVCEPAIKEYIKLEDIGLVIVPGVAFDDKRNRLGRGKGCYDHFLKRLPRGVPTIGLAFDFQILPFLPSTSTDVSVGRVISN
ncbi:MAG: 5-formyltetrahydrofolate cyclo-ligase [Candidatus Omnitrophica bacterium]|nr:5-formyltetrahydrofolate cyclo-ligase [Candidatus Omnitrophota bacterium]MDD5552494.1 5-formyltetrahydrofolate cyclo-ligase [Candidatus Omnitrophota bacterium]